MGHAAVADLGSAVTVSAHTTHRGGYEVKPSSYRTVKVKGFALPAAASAGDAA